MRPPEFLRLLCLIALCACGCAHLPTVGLGVRSSWRAQTQPAGRHVEVLAGVSIGWSGASYAARPQLASIDDDPYAVAEGALAYAGPVCTEPLFCRWESAQRESALAREGVRDEREGAAPEGVTP